MRPILLLLILTLSLEVFSQDARQYYSLGRKALKERKFDEAINYLTKAIELNDQQPSFWNQRGAIKAAANRHDEALLDYNKAIALNETNAVYWYNRGVSYERLGKLTNARDDFQKALNIKPDLWAVESGLGNIALEYEDYSTAITHFQKARNLNPNAFNPPNNLAYAFNQIKQYGQAIASAKAAIQINENGASAYNHLAYANFQQGNRSGAMENVNKSIQLDPNYAKAYFTRGLIYESQNNLPLAKMDYEKAVDLTPTFQAFFNQPYNALKELKKRIETSLPPEILITAPISQKSRGFKVVKEGSIETSEASILVQGRVLSVNDLRSTTVQGSAVTLDLDGYFEKDVALQVGDNAVKVESADVLGQKSQVELTIVRKASSTPKNVNYGAVNTGKYYAILIAMQEYDHPQIGNLAKPLRDVNLLKSALEDTYDFDNHHIRVVKDPSRGELYNLLDRYALVVGPNDNFIVFYAGHGHWDPKFRRGYWLLRDSAPTNRSTWFPSSDLKDYINAIKSKHTLLISDACFSGSIFENRDPEAGQNIGSTASGNERFNIPSRIAMTSGTLKPVPDESIFLRYLVNSIREYGGQTVGSADLFNKLREAVILNTDNVPLYGEIVGTGGAGGDFVLAK